MDPCVNVDEFWRPLILLLLVLLLLGVRYLKLAKTATPVIAVTNAAVKESDEDKRREPNTTHDRSTEWYRALFFQLQNLEDYPGALELAHEELLAMFSHALSVAFAEKRLNNCQSIISLENYSAEAMLGFLKNAHEKTMSDWTRYLERRKQGQGPEIFATAENAKYWLVQQAPVKFVDGAWLGHVHKITTPFALRGVTKHAWQVLSEELGDGDPEKHHVSLYRSLLESIGRPLPSGHSADFIHATEWERDDNHGAWEAAVGQLAISLFPNEFLPEILGFNMHFEEIRLDTMQVAYELKHHGIDPYYFLIHISIDNADSGHTAMAYQAVVQYLGVVRSMEGDEAVSRAWKRIQVGYILSQTLGHYPRPSKLGPTSSEVLPSALNTQVLQIFRSKAAVSLSMHSQSRARIGRFTLREWLEATLRTDCDEFNLLNALSGAKPWVVAGDSSKSQLVRELSWRGRMFGAFTKNEVSTICRWIDALGYGRDPFLYWNFTQRQPVSSAQAVAKLQDPVSHHPYVPAGNAPNIQHAFNSYKTPFRYTDVEMGVWDALAEHPPINTSCARLPDIISLWFAHISLLENTINTPSRTVEPIYMNILRLLRAQAGFGIECDIVAGMDEVRRNFCPSLVDIGLELTENLSQIAISARPQTMKQVFLLVASHGQSSESFRFANDMLLWSAAPSANLGFLLGIALAFVELKHAISRDPDLLSLRSRLFLQAIVAREKRCLEECARELRSTNIAVYGDLLRGNYLAVSVLPKCIK
ncbi:hypothetical protein NLG97_g1931 [Lecanicillium saksenae]|uniref:Uncharacterized protein n=1 Tax=Lecanicillium saksenae TaxID=468837 RepID=A0ACC1R490_9HYPO|nr:hypothetical protein NLG97_g1931 [Lecanicillium saksenae]